MKTLLIYARYVDMLSYFDDWMDAFQNSAEMVIDSINICALPQIDAETFKKISGAQLIILHHSMLSDTLEFITPLITALASRNGKLISFVGNEVNLPILGMKPRLDVLKKIKPDMIMTQLLQEAGDWLYAECNTKILSVPHALNPKSFNTNTPYQGRPIDIGTRSHKYGVMIGDNDRNEIMHWMESLDGRLNVDLGQKPGSQQRFNREEWSAFLGSSKATTSTEAGSFYLERDDATITAIESHLKATSGKITLPRENTARKLYRKLVPSPVRSYLYDRLKSRVVETHALDTLGDFEEIQTLFFKNKSRCPAYSKAISSRHFDAIGTRTLQILFPGRYNDILKANEHYFELKRDGSNRDELIKLLNNPSQWQDMVNRTYDYIINNHTHAHRVKTILENI